VILVASFILILCVAVALAKDEHLIGIEERVVCALRERDILFQGHRLYEWLDGVSSENGALNLSAHHQRENGLPKKDCYREFGAFVHKLWEDVRNGQGQIKGPLRAIKMLLRSDLQRTRRERQVLGSAYAQIIVMILMVWLYLFSFDYFVAINPPWEFWCACVLWQTIGGFLFFVLLKKKREKLFDPLNDLLSALLALNIVAYRGHLGLGKLPQPKSDLSGDCLRYYQGLESTQDAWRRQGRANPETLEELREDLALLSEDAQLNFLPWIRGLGFLWAMVFVLPLLFGGSLFGLYKLAVV
jgi:hypothetical protein